MWEKLRRGADADLEHVRAMLIEPDEWGRVKGDGGKRREGIIGGLRVTAADMVLDVFLWLIDDKGPIVGIIQSKAEKEQHDPACAR